MVKYEIFNTLIDTGVSHDEARPIAVCRVVDGKIESVKGRYKTYKTAIIACRATNQKVARENAHPQGSTSENGYLDRLTAVLDGVGGEEAS